MNNPFNIKPHDFEGHKIAEIITDGIVIKTAEDGLDLLGNLYYQGYDKIVIYKNNIDDNFFNLQNGIAGEILQKFSTYRVKLAVVGNFHDIPSKSLKDFIRESNRQGHTTFADSLPAALAAW